MIETYINSRLKDSDFPSLVMAFRGSDQTVGSSVLVSHDGSIEIPLSTPVSSVTNGVATFAIATAIAPSKGSIPAFGTDFLVVSSGHSTSTADSLEIGDVDSGEGVRAGSIVATGAAVGAGGSVTGLTFSNSSNGTFVAIASDGTAVKHYEGDPADDVLDAVGAGSTATAIGAVTPDQLFRVQLTLRFLLVYKFTALPADWLSAMTYHLAVSDGKPYPAWAGVS